MAVTQSFLDALTERLREGLEEKLSAYTESGHPLEEVGSPEEIARRMLRVLPETSRWDELLGPFYTTSRVAELLGGISRQAVADRRERRTLFALKTADGALVYPAFQLDSENRFLTGLPEVLRCFQPDEVDGWTLGGWLVSPLRSLEGLSVVQWLRSGRELAPALAAAREAARRFSH